MTINAAAARAAEVLQQVRTLYITAGAGMGVDSGLPDFRGDKGFWQAYPPYARLGINFVNAANPRHFEDDPSLGWGFYGHRTNLYRETVPHSGFHLLQEWGTRFDLEIFVITSNVDGQFQKAGFSEEQILEIHGSIHHLQCTVPCGRDIWDNDEVFPIDESTMRSGHIPLCPFCGRTARPNILMFGDYSWLHQRSAAQEEALDHFQATHPGPAVIIEMGAGTMIPSIRHLSEQLGRKNGTVVRINPRESQIGAPHISMACGALAGLQAIDQQLTGD